MQKSVLLESSFPVSYRQDILTQMAPLILKLESFSFIGMEDNCKSNVLRFLSFRSDVQKKYFPKNKLLFVWVDLNELQETGSEYFFQLISSSLPETQGNHSFSSPSSLKLLKTSLSNIIKATGKNVILVFNDFDLLPAGKLELISRNLISLRNSARFKISYIFVSAKPFSPKHSFFQKIIYMTPFKGIDAKGVVIRNLARYNVNLGLSDIQKVIDYSGGHAGTIKFIIQSLSEGNSQKIDLRSLSKDSDISFQQERIISSLSDIQKAKLKANIKDEFLLKMGLQKETAGKVTAFSPLLSNYLKKEGVFIKPFCWDAENNEIFYCGIPVTKELTRKERELLKLLIANDEKVFSKDEIIESIWKNEEFPTDWAFDKLVSRLRKKLKIDSKNGQPIRTIHGIGITLY